MSAEELGRRLLGEAEEEGLDRLLHSLRLLNEPEALSRFNIPQLDRLLHASQPGPATTHATRPNEQPGSSPRQTAHGAQQRKLKAIEPVLEITSAGPGAGKTHLLYLITAIAVLPPVHAGIPLNGKNAAVVVLDTDNRFSVRRLAQVMQHYISQQQQQQQHDEKARQQPPPSASDPRSLLQDSLQHVHVFRPPSHPSLLATLSSLPTYLLSPTPSHFSAARPLHSIILASATSFYWPLRAAEENARLGVAGPGVASPTAGGGGSGGGGGGGGGGSRGPPAAVTAQNEYARLVHRLRGLQRGFGCAVVATTWGLAAAPPARPLLPRAWAAFVTVRVGVARVAGRRFERGMSVEEALGMEREREEEREGGGAGGARFAGWVDEGGREGREDEGGERRFGFWVGDGVEVVSV